MAKGGKSRGGGEELGTEANMLGAAWVALGDRCMCHCPRSEASEHFGALSLGHWGPHLAPSVLWVFLCFSFLT